MGNKASSSHRRAGNVVLGAANAPGTVPTAASAFVIHEANQQHDEIAALPVASAVVTDLSSSSSSSSYLTSSSIFGPSTFAGGGGVGSPTRSPIADNERIIEDLLRENDTLRNEATRFLNQGIELRQLNRNMTDQLQLHATNIDRLRAELDESNTKIVQLQSLSLFTGGISLVLFVLYFFSGKTPKATTATDNSINYSGGGAFNSMPDSRILRMLPVLNVFGYFFIFILLHGAALWVYKLSNRNGIPNISQIYSSNLLKFNMTVTGLFYFWSVVMQSPIHNPNGSILLKLLAGALNFEASTILTKNLDVIITRRITRKVFSWLDPRGMGHISCYIAINLMSYVAPCSISEGVFRANSLLGLAQNIVPLKPYVEAKYLQLLVLSMLLYYNHQRNAVGQDHQDWSSYGFSELYFSAVLVNLLFDMYNAAKGTAGLDEQRYVLYASSILYLVLGLALGVPLLFGIGFVSWQLLQLDFFDLYSRHYFVYESWPNARAGNANPNANPNPNPNSAPILASVPNNPAHPTANGIVAGANSTTNAAFTRDLGHLITYHLDQLNRKMDGLAEPCLEYLNSTFGSHNLALITDARLADCLWMSYKLMPLTYFCIWLTLLKFRSSMSIMLSLDTRPILISVISFLICGWGTIFNLIACLLFSQRGALRSEELRSSYDSWKHLCLIVLIIGGLRLLIFFPKVTVSLIGLFTYQYYKHNL